MCSNSWMNKKQNPNSFWIENCSIFRKTSFFSVNRILSLSQNRISVFVAFWRADVVRNQSLVFEGDNHARHVVAASSVAFGRIFFYFSKCLEISQNVSKCFKISQNDSNVSKSLEMFGNVLKWNKIFWNVQKCYAISQNIFKCFEM